MKDSAFLKTLARKPCEYVPLWLMRQAGRYLPEYWQVRNKAGSFLDLCKNPELATEVTLQPLRRFKLDAAIMFSDILVVPEAMGMQLYFSDGKGPQFANPLTIASDLRHLRTVDVRQDLAFVFDTIKNIKQELPANIPLIGFSGSPFTLACYMLEGGASKNYEKIKAWVYQYPVQLHQLLTQLTDVVATYLANQIVHGVDAIMLFDSWGGVLSQQAFLEFSLPYMNKVFELLKAAHHGQTPSISFTKGSGGWLPHLDKLNVTALGIDWMSNLATARSITGKILQGNLDPVILSVADPKIVKREACKILDDYYQANNESYAGLVFNLGHGILPTAKIENVSMLVDTIHEYTHRL